MSESEETPEAPEHPLVGCEDWGDGMYPLHEEWATGEIEGREYRVLRSLQGPHVLVEFPQDDYDDYHEERTVVSFDIGDMVQHAHSVTKEEVDDEAE